MIKIYNTYEELKPFFLSDRKKVNNLIYNTYEELKRDFCT